MKKKIIQIDECPGSDNFFGSLTVLYDNGEIWRKSDEANSKWSKVLLPHEEKK